VNELDTIRLRRLMCRAGSASRVNELDTIRLRRNGS